MLILSGQGLQPFSVPTHRITDKTSSPCWRCQMLTQARLKDLLYYDPGTGFCTWRVFRGGRVVAGSKAGSLDGKGYMQINIGGQVHRLHRVIWLYMTGVWPSEEIDHKNTIGTDNRWRNLRLATSTINKENRQKHNRNNDVGVLGVGVKGKKFRARIMVERKEINLGIFETPAAAHQAYVNAKRRYHKGGLL